MLRVRSLSCERDHRLLFADLNFDLREGRVIQVKGGNGTGKTTLLRMLCGLFDTQRSYGDYGDHGEDGEGGGRRRHQASIEWYGKPIGEQREEFAADLLYIGHRAGVNKVLTPLENLRWSCGIQQAVNPGQILQALHRVGLGGFEEAQCLTLSAGQQQRLSLARLLICQARLWILDEPFTTLDVDGVALLEQLIGEHAAGGGGAVVTSHHPLAIAGLQTLVLGGAKPNAEESAHD